MAPNHPTHRSRQTSRTGRDPSVTYEWLVWHGRFEIDLEIERRIRAVRHSHGDGFVQVTADRLYRYPEAVCTNLARRGVVRPKRKKSAHISSRSRRVKVRVHFHQAPGLDEPTTPLPQSDVHLGPRIKSPITVDFMTEPAVSNPGVKDSFQHTVGPGIPFGRRESGPSITKASRCHKHRLVRVQTESHLTGMRQSEHVYHRAKISICHGSSRDESSAMEIIHAKGRPSGNNTGPKPSPAGVIERDIHTLPHRESMTRITCRSLGRTGAKHRQGHTHTTREVTLTSPMRECQVRQLPQLF